VTPRTGQADPLRSFRPHPGIDVAFLSVDRAAIVYLYLESPIRLSGWQSVLSRTELTPNPVWQPKPLLVTGTLFAAPTGWPRPLAFAPGGASSDLSHRTAGGRPQVGALERGRRYPKRFPRNKYKFDEKHGQWRLSKVLHQGLSFPYDFGFVPSTRGEDDDPVVVLLLMDEAAFPGCVVPAQLIGVLEAEQTEGDKTVRKDRLVAVVETSYNPAEFHSLEEVSERRLDEIEHFFVSYNQMEGRRFKPLARRGADDARNLLEELTGVAGAGGNGARRSRGRGKK